MPREAASEYSFWHVVETKTSLMASLPKDPPDLESLYEGVSENKCNNVRCS